MTVYCGLKPWELGRLTVAEFEEYVAAAEYFRTHDTRFVKEE